MKRPYNMTNVRISSIPKYPKQWAMLAEDIDKVGVDALKFPLLGQPKLNGIRALWTGRELVSRQRLIWPEHVLPTLYKTLYGWSRFYPGVYLDGEIYIHGRPFQLLAGAVNIHQTTASPLDAELEFHAFDMIAPSLTCVERMMCLKDTYSKWVPVCQLNSPNDIDPWVKRFREAGFEGLMLRDPEAFYTVGRTKSLIKIKPWIEFQARIIAFVKGNGKYSDTLGALVLLCQGRLFKASGGISDEARDQIWRHQKDWKGRFVTAACREFSLDGLPIQPQIRNLNPSSIPESNGESTP